MQRSWRRVQKSSWSCEAHTTLAPECWMGQHTLLFFFFFLPSASPGLSEKRINTTSSSPANRLFHDAIGHQQTKQMELGQIRRGTPSCVLPCLRRAVLGVPPRAGCHCQAVRVPGRVARRVWLPASTAASTA